MNPFDFVNTINDKSVNLMLGDADAEKKYVPFIVNRAFSQFSDTALAVRLFVPHHKETQEIFKVGKTRLGYRHGNYDFRVLFC